MTLLPSYLFRSLLAILSLFPLWSQAQTTTDDKVSAQFQTYRAATFAARQTYRKSLAELLAEADKVEVFLLDFEMGIGKFADPQSPDLFPIKPYEDFSKILKRRELSINERKRLLPSLHANLSAKEELGGALCHFPIHGLRFWTGDQILFESSFCWMCRNLYVEYPDSDARWFEFSHPELEKIMRSLMPIPEKEVERFKAKFPNQKL